MHVGCTGHFEADIETHNPGWLHGQLSIQYGKDVYGLDLNKLLLDDMKQRGYSNLYHGDASRSEDWPDKQFDCIVAGELIEHIGNAQSFLQSCHDHLTPDGVLILTTPYAWSLWYLMYALIHYPYSTENREHTQIYDPAMLSELAGRAGLTFDLYNDVEIIRDNRTDTPNWKYNWIVRLVNLLTFWMPTRIIGKTMIVTLRDATIAHQ